MAQVNTGSTDPDLIKRVAALRDNPAWGEFFEQYNPLVTDWCSAYGLDSESVDELRQRVWVELVRRMPAYQYDPGGSFRHWLSRLCRHRAIDLYRERLARPIQSLDEDQVMEERGAAVGNDDGEPGGGKVAAERLRLFQEAREAHEEVKSKVKPIRWEVFWRVMIEGESMSEAAAALGLKYATAYAAVKHVATLLQAEGRRRRAPFDLNHPPMLEED